MDEKEEYIDDSIYTDSDFTEESVSQQNIDLNFEEDYDSALKTNQTETLSNTKNPNKRNRCSVPKNVTKSEKKLLAALVEKEVLLWDLHHENHSSIHALQAAWDRVALKMHSNRSASDCKAIWKSLKDSLRYRRKREMGKTGTSGDEAETQCVTDAWEFDDCMAFLAPMSTKYPRKTIVMGMESITSKGYTNEISSDIVLNKTEAASSPNEGSSSSNYSYAVGKKKDVLSESVINMTKSLSDFVKQRASTAQRPEKQLKFEHLWSYLDNLFDKMKPEQRDQLNLQYVAMAINMLQEE